MPPDTDSESSDSESDSETESSRYGFKDLQNCGVKKLLFQCLSRNLKMYAFCH